jgi:membrane-associated phospholipid phosphatase
VLQSIDIAAFRFVNGTLSNSFFDAIMPIFAGGGWFFPLIFVLGLALIWKGGTRGRLCVLMLAIVIPLGDGWIANTIKHAVGRARPCLALQNVNLPMRNGYPDDEDDEFRRSGCSDSGSMPSGHTTNWFASTMVAWIFYRRTLRFMLPLALTVAFSRVYNGVHYPTDVLVGAIVGAGYGVAIVFAVDAVWHFAAQRWFPLWWDALPALVPAPDPHASQVTPAASPSAIAHMASGATPADHWLRLGYVLIIAVFAARLLFLASGRIELSEDEAYQWLWSKHLALSYFSKPPLIAYVQWLGTQLFGDTELGVRFFSPVCAAIGSLVALRFFARHVSARAGLWLIVIFNVTPLLVLGSTLMTVDPLLVLFWTLAMFAGWRAVQRDGTTAHWALVGLWMGLGFLSKYTALLQWLCWAVFFILWQPARAHLRRPGPYVALLANLACATPVIIWNVQHGWIGVAHVANDAKASRGWSFDWHAPLEFLGGSIGLLHPIFFGATLWAAVAMWRRGARDPLLRFFFAMGAPLFLVYLFYTFHSSVLINWIAASVIPLFCLMVTFWDRRFGEGTPHMRGTLAVAIALGGIAVALLHETDLAKKMTGISLPVKLDPLRRVRGWSHMAHIVERERETLLEEGHPVFIVGGHYGTTGLLSFYIPEAKQTVEATPLVYYRKMARPNTQFFFWPGYTGTRRGENALYVQQKDKPQPAPIDIVKQFASVTEVGHFAVHHRGRVMHYVQVFACRELLR